MKPVRITALVQADYPELSRQLELPMDQPCSIPLGSVWVSEDCTMPRTFCPSAWQSLYPYVFALSAGAEHLYDSWMKKPGTALVSCSDGFRPLSFLLEVIEEQE